MLSADRQVNTKLTRNLMVNIAELCLITLQLKIRIVDKSNDIVPWVLD